MPEADDAAASEVRPDSPAAFPLQKRETVASREVATLEVQLAASARALSDANNQLHVEIAERGKAEAALRQAQKLRTVGQLVGGIAHDFNNMLATVLGSLELMERRIQTNMLVGDDVENRRHMVLIERAGAALERGARLTSLLVAFSRRQRVAACPTDLNRLISDLLMLAASSLGRNVTIETDLSPDAKPAFADPSEVEAAILNLCLNARDAMPNGGVLLIATDHETIPSAHGTEAASPGMAPGDYIRITVSDTGCGMTQDVLARVFEPFFSTKNSAGGLGLRQVHGLARESGGRVCISSMPGEGTKVELLLPQACAGMQR